MDQFRRVCFCNLIGVYAYDSFAGLHLHDIEATDHGSNKNEMESYTALKSIVHLSCQIPTGT